MLWFNFTLATIWYFLCFGVWYKYMIMNIKQKKIPDGTKGKIEPPHHHSVWRVFIGLLSKHFHYGTDVVSALFPTA